MAFNTGLFVSIIVVGCGFNACCYIAWRRYRRKNFMSRPPVDPLATYSENCDIPAQDYADAWDELARIIGIPATKLRRTDTIEMLRGPMQGLESRVDDVEELVAREELEHLRTFGDLVDAAVRFKLRSQQKENRDFAI